MARRAFTLVEMMVAFAILSLIMVLVVEITSQTERTWQSTHAKIESFQGARAAFEAVARRLGQTTLNNYYGYFPNLSTPTKYVRKSELHFICGKSLLTSPPQVTHAVFFQAPLGYTNDTDYEGLDNLLNACGYFVEYNNDNSRPTFLTALPDRHRYRLMQFSQPAQELSVYQYTSGPDPNQWFTAALASPAPPTRQMAENVVALIIRPRLSAGDEAKAGAPIAPEYEYDTRDASSPKTEHQLPPLVEVVLVAIDELSAGKLGNTTEAPNLGQSSLFQQTDNLEKDLATFSDVLNAQPDNIAGNRLKLNSRVFRMEVPLHAAKWSAYD